MPKRVLSPESASFGEQLPKMSTINTRAKAALSANSSASSSATGQVRGQGMRGIVSVSDLVDQISCGLCGRAINDEPIKCSYCNRQYHPSSQCTGLKPLTIRCIGEEASDAIQYKCTACQCSPVANPSNTSAGGGGGGEWREAVGQVLEMVKSLAVSMKEMQETMSRTLQDQVNSNQMPNSQGQGGEEMPVLRKDLYSDLWEFEERKKRVSSIIVRGSGATTQAEFTGKFKRVYQHLMDAAPNVTNTHCISAEKSIFRVTLSEKSAKVQLLNVANKLKDSAEYSNIYISRDLTLAQRKAISAERAKRPRRRNSPRRSSGETAERQPPHRLTGGNSTPLSAAENNHAFRPAASGSGEQLSFQ